MNVVDVFGYVGVGAGVVGFAGAALYTGRSKAVISLQQDEITALRESNSRLQGDNHSLTYQNTNTEAEMKRLQNMVQSVPAFEKLTIQMAKQHKEVITSLSQVATELSKVAATIASSAKDSNRRERNGTATQ